MTAQEFLLPDVGEGLTEAELLTWHVKVGDVVIVNQALVDIETAKSVVELPSPYAGRVVAVLVPEGETVAVGTPIVRIEEEGAAAAQMDLSNPAASGGSEGESLVGRAMADRRAVRRRRRQPDAVAEPEIAVAVADERPVRVRTKPLVRRLARDLGVDLATVAPTGPEGTVTKDDVLAVASASVPAGTSSGSGVMTRDSYDVRVQGRETSSGSEVTTRDSYDVREGGGGGETRIPVKGVTRAMADAMTASAFTAPHVTEWITVDCSAAVAWTHRIRERREFAGLRVTPTLLVAKACIAAMRRTPEINSSFVTQSDGSADIVLHDHVNLGLAAATPRGLVVPNVKDAHTLDLVGLARAVTTLVDTAKEGRTPPADLAGGTFTITNVGTFGVDGGTPIINPGESAILAVGAIAKRPWVDEENGELCVRDVVTLSLSFDHRHVDGEKGSRFLTDVANVLRDPEAALLL